MMMATPPPAAPATRPVLALESVVDAPAFCDGRAPQMVSLLDAHASRATWPKGQTVQLRQAASAMSLHARTYDELLHVGRGLQAVHAVQLLMYMLTGHASTHCDEL